MPPTKSSKAASKKRKDGKKKKKDGAVLKAVTREGATVVWRRDDDEKTDVVAKVLQNGTVDGHVALKVKEGSLHRAKPEALTLACSYCETTEAALTVCGACRSVAFCGKECQRAAWKAFHKDECAALKERNSIEEELEWKEHDHTSWKTLAPHVRRELRLHHAKFACQVPWPISFETDPMLQTKLAMPSFLSRHPNMFFTVLRKRLPGGFAMHYRDNGASELTGKTFPHDQFVPVLQEKPSSANVPPHSPGVMTFAVIGECVFTRACLWEMKDFYGSAENKGALFDWPDGRAVPICPATNTTVKPDGRTVHLLVACNLAGTAVAATSQLTRVIPRVMTLKGYHSLFETADDKRLASGGEDDASPPGEDFYPAVMRRMVLQKTGVLPASVLWARFHDAGYYLAYERLLEIERPLHFRSFHPDFHRSHVHDLDGNHSSWRASGTA